MTVRKENSATDLVTFAPTAGGTLEFPSGRKYLWTATQHEWSFKEANGEVVIHIKLTGQRAGNLSGEVALSPAALVLPEVSLLLLLAWYVLVLASKDATEGMAALQGVLAGVMSA